MKKLILMMFVLALPLAAFAEDKSDGCGLGWQVTNKQSFLGTTTRGTTNGFVPPTFGMTSGTIGCAQHSFAKKDVPAAQYVVANFEPLSIQMAEGTGEYVDGLATELGCADRAAFGRQVQKNYRTLMNKADAVQLFVRVKALGCSA